MQELLDEPAPDWLSCVPSIETRSSPLYLVKWKNLSYRAATWETELELQNDAEKIKDFCRHNRALLKEQRQEFISRNQKQSELATIIQNQNKRGAKPSP